MKQSTPHPATLYVPATRYVHLKWNTQWHLSGTSPRRLGGTSSRRPIGMTSHQYLSTTPQLSLKWNTQRCLSGTSQDVSMVLIHDVPLVRLYDVSCNSQMKNPITSLWYISTTSESYNALPLLRSLLRFQITLSWPPASRFSRLIYASNQTSHFSGIHQEGIKGNSLNYKLGEILLHVKTASYINNICGIFCVDIYF